MRCSGGKEDWVGKQGEENLTRKQYHFEIKAES